MVSDEDTSRDVVGRRPQRLTDPRRLPSVPPASPQRPRHSWPARINPAPGLAAYPTSDSTTPYWSPRGLPAADGTPGEGRRGGRGEGGLRGYSRVVKTPRELTSYTSYRRDLGVVVGRHYSCTVLNGSGRDCGVSRGLESGAGREDLGGEAGSDGLGASIGVCVPSGLILRVVYMGTAPWSGDIHGWE